MKVCSEVRKSGRLCEQRRVFHSPLKAGKGRTEGPVPVDLVRSQRNTDFLVKARSPPSRMQKMGLVRCRRSQQCAEKPQKLVEAHDNTEIL